MEALILKDETGELEDKSIIFESNYFVLTSPDLMFCLSPSQAVQLIDYLQKGIKLT